MGERMKEIVVVSPFGFMTETAARAIEQLACANVDLVEASVFNAAEIVERAVRHGAKMIISRGGVFDLLRLRIDIPLIEVEVTAFDLIEAFSALGVHDKETCIGVIGFPNVIGGAEIVAQAMGLQAKIVEIADESEIDAAVDALSRDGVGHFLGDSEVGGAVARRQGVFVMVRSGIQAMRHAIQRAVEMLDASRREKERAQLFASVIDLVHDGVVAVDAQSCITVFNKAAEKLIGVGKEAAIGKKITEIVAETRLPEMIEGSLSESADILTLDNGVTVAANRVPVAVDGEVRGAVATYQDVGEVQRLERKIRIRLSEKGFVAQYDFSDIVHASASIAECIRIARKFSRYDATVLITGPSGVGKELFAQGIHNNSLRKHSPFVAINCAALPETLIESELFGYAEGAFTGASRKGKAGLFEMAHGGTLFLDEISELPLVLQGRLLRVLQEKEIMRIGDNKLIPVDVRIVCATNRDLSSLVREKRFRSDLYFRIATLGLYIPPLNGRSEDIDRLAGHFLKAFAKEYRKEHLVFGKEAAEYLRHHTYSGNVRELKGMIERAVVISEGKSIGVDDLRTQGALEMPELSTTGSAGQLAGQPAGQLTGQHFQLRGCSLAEVESEYIEHVFRSTRGSIKKSSEILGIGRSTLWRKVKMLGIQPEW